MRDRIEIRGAREHNLRAVDLDLPHGRLIVLTGVSGSGKSSLAFDTIYAEARRRFLLTAEGGAAAFAQRLQPPRVQRIDGLRPALAIAQARHRPSSRSTAATITGLADYLRLLWARVGRARCLECGEPVAAHAFEEVLERASGRPEGSRLVVTAPMAPPATAAHARELIAEVERSGYRRLRCGPETLVLEDVEPSRIVGRPLEVVVDRVAVRTDTRRRLRGSLQAAVQLGRGRVGLVDPATGAEERYSVRPACAGCGAAFPDISAALFSFNSPAGACPDCHGTGRSAGSSFERLLSAGEPPAASLAVLWERFGHRRLQREVDGFCRRARVDLSEPLSEWPEEVVRALWEGEGPRPRGKPFPGLRRWLDARAGAADDREERAWLEEVQENGAGESPCGGCGGRRLSAAALAVRIDGESIADLLGRTLSEAADWLRGVAIAPEQRALADHILDVVRQGVAVMLDLGLGYLTLDRRAPTLSAGELQRLQLVAALGSGLSQVLYVLDEPSAGLHGRDTRRLGAALERLRDRGNSVLVVEHDLDLVRAADLLVELGPGAGDEGGRLLFRGPPREAGASGTATGQALAGDGPARRNRTPGAGGWLRLLGARGHNLQGLDLSLPLGCLVSVTGVSGSGKSSLVHHTLHAALAARLQGAGRRPLPFDELRGSEALERVVAVDQSPIGRTARSNAATYTGLMAVLRQLFAELPESRLRGYHAGHFSFNSAGACSRCGGTGREPEAAVDLEDLPLPCSRCAGTRYRREVLEIRFRGLSIAEALELSVAEAGLRFANVPEAARRLGLLTDLGLGYLRLGQPASHLSGGEAQRVKLSAELGRPAVERTLYLLDEPTSGLHRCDSAFLVELLQRLVDRGHTVLVVEHDPYVIAASDHVVDLGPEAGGDGGRVVVTGTPDEVAACEASHTGRVLRGAFSAVPGV